jgi:hypothetical protein
MCTRPPRSADRGLEAGRARAFGLDQRRASRAKSRAQGVDSGRCGSHTASRYRGISPSTRRAPGQTREVPRRWPAAPPAGTSSSRQRPSRRKYGVAARQEARGRGRARRRSIAGSSSASSHSSPSGERTGRSEPFERRERVGRRARARCRPSGRTAAAAAGPKDVEVAVRASSRQAVGGRDLRDWNRPDERRSRASPADRDRPGRCARTASRCRSRLAGRARGRSSACRGVRLAHRSAMRSARSRPLAVPAAAPARTSAKSRFGTTYVL